MQCPVRVRQPHHTVTHQHLERSIVLARVEVARHDHRIARRIARRNALQQERRAPLA
jgi:hypothetical protein